MAVPEFQWAQFGQTAGNALAQGLMQRGQRQQQNALGQALSGAMQGNPQDLQTAYSLNPAVALQVQQHQQTQKLALDEKQKEAFAADLTGGIAAVYGVPEEQRPAVYAKAAALLKQKYPTHAANISDQFDDASTRQVGLMLATQYKQAADVLGRVGVLPQEQKPFELAPGAQRYDASGKLIASAPARETPTELQRNLSDPTTAAFLRQQEARLRSGAGDANKPPSGYRWSAGGALEAIPGGPADPKVRAQGSGGLTIDPETGALTATGFKTKAIPAEQGARIALGKSYASQVPDILASIEEGKTAGLQNRVGVAAGMGIGGAVARRQKSGVDALIRNLTGAGMTVSEAEEYAGRYRIQSNDSQTTQRNKVLQLVQELRTTDETIHTQYGQKPSAEYEGIPSPPSLSDEMGPRGTLPSDIDAILKKHGGK